MDSINVSNIEDNNIEIELSSINLNQKNIINFTKRGFFDSIQESTKTYLLTDFATNAQAVVLEHNTDADAHNSILNLIENINKAMPKKADVASIPTKTSQLTNDSRFATSSQIPSIPTQISAFANDSNYTTSEALASGLSGKANTSLNNITQSTALSNLGFGGMQLNTNGYYKLPNGLILQWGYFDLGTSGTNTTITFPIAFPNKLLTINRTIVTASNGSASNDLHSIYTQSLTGFHLTYYYPFYWFAAGY